MNWILIVVLTSAITFWPNFVKNYTDTTKSNEVSNSLSDIHVAEIPDIYFTGHGLSPTWKLSIAPDSILFDSEIAGVESIRTGHREPVKELNSKVYNCQLVNGQLHIEIAQESCTIDGSNESFSYRLVVEMIFNEDNSVLTFEGCGHYVTDVHLAGTWLLEQIKGQPVSTGTAYESLPSVAIEPKRNSFSGFAGCNKISGRIFSQRNLLRFTDIVSTKMSCDDMDKEDEFLEALQFSTQFVVEENQLILSNPLNTTLIFKKEK